MGPKFYLSLLVLCFTLFLEIGAFPEDDIKGQSGFLIRKKRIIDHSPEGNKPVSIEHIPYIVNILRNGKDNCGGTILLNDIIITAAHCVFENDVYTILSGSSFRRNGTLHHVRRLIINQQYNMSKHWSDLALLKIFPPIDLVHSPNRNIELHNGHILPNSYGTISGWGWISLSPTRTCIYPNELRSINVPIISQLECQNFYHGIAPITSKNICTHDTERLKGSCHGDSGGPLVVDGRLIGVNSWTSQHLKDPDVFINVAEPHHAVWISVTIRRLTGKF